jgi:hypothetical protein
VWECFLWVAKGLESFLEEEEEEVVAAAFDLDLPGEKCRWIRCWGWGCGGGGGVRVPLMRITY